MRFPDSVLRIHLNQFFNILFLLSSLLYLSGCSVSKIYQEILPSNFALQSTDFIRLEKFEGENSVLFEKIFYHEMSQQSFFKNATLSSDILKKNVALVTAKVTRYNIHDFDEIKQSKSINLVEKNKIQNNSSVSNSSKNEFYFVEKIIEVPVIHRTLDLEIRFVIKNSESNKVIHDFKENTSFKNSYVGEERILLIPDSKDEMVRLAEFIMKKFFNKIIPEKREIVIELEKGTDPIKWSFGLLDFGHPKIIRSNHYATGKRYDLALKGWNYVLFEPRPSPESENYFFNDEVYISLKKSKFPASILQNLFSIYGKSFNENEVNKVLLSLLSDYDYNKYSRFVKSQSRLSKSINFLNLASAHFNLGKLHQLSNDLELADYHYAKAYSYNSEEKYSRAWTEIQHLKGNYNPLNDLTEISVESSKNKPPPKNAILHPK